MNKDLKHKLKDAWLLIGKAQSVITWVAEQHTAAGDTHSEKWHDSDAGERAEMDAGELEDAQASMEEVVACLDRIIH